MVTEESKDKEEVRRPFFKTPWKIVIFSCFLVALILSITFVLIKRSRYVWTNDAFIEGFGTDLSSNVTERILKLYVDEGDYVVKGQKVALLQNNVPLAQHKEAEANIESTKQEILVKEAFYLKLKSDYKRAVEGLKDHIISVQDYEHKERDFQRSEAELQLACANYELAKTRLSVIDAKLTHYEILAPQDGVIAKRWVWVGDVVQPGQSLFTMFDLKDVWILANLEEKKLRKVKLGDSVDIHIDAYPGYTFKGKIFTIKGAAASKFTLVPQNNATGNYTKVEQRVPIKISIQKPENFPDNEPLYLFPGMSAEIFVRIK